MNDGRVGAGTPIPIFTWKNHCWIYPSTSQGEENSFSSWENPIFPTEFWLFPPCWGVLAAPTEAPKFFFMFFPQKIPKFSPKFPARGAASLGQMFSINNKPGAGKANPIRPEEFSGKGLSFRLLLSNKTDFSSEFRGFFQLGLSPSFSP